MYKYSEFAGKIDLTKAIRDLNKLSKIIQEVFVTDEGSYKGLNEYNNAKYSFIHGRLRWYKFVQGQHRKNTVEVNPEAAFWKNVYESIGKTLEYGKLPQDANTIDRQEVDLKIIENIKNELTN